MTKVTGILDLDIKMLLDQFKYSIDSYHGDKESPHYFLRIRNAGTTVVNHSFGNPCIMLTSNGCAMRKDKKPNDGQSMKCIRPSSNIECCKRWEKYSYILKELVKEYENM